MSTGNTHSVNKNNPKTSTSFQPSGIPSDEETSLELKYTNLLAKDAALRVGSRLDSGEIDDIIYRWKETGEVAHWHIQSNDEVIRHCLKWLEQYHPGKYHKKNAKSCIESAVPLLKGKKSLPALARRAVLPVRGAYLHIDNCGVITAKAPDASLGLTYTVPATFDWSRVDDNGVYVPRPMPVDSLFGRYIRRVQPDEAVRTVLQEGLASSLLPACYEKAIWLQGGGENGKSVLLKLITAFHPKHAAFKLLKLTDDNHIASLRDVTLALVAETPNQPFDENQMKALVSRDIQSGRKLYNDVMTFVPRATWLLLMNDMPPVRDHTHGFWRKVLGIPFSVRISPEEKDVNLASKILGDPVEMSVMLDWLLEGAARLVARGAFDEANFPEAITALTRQQRVESDSAFAFAQSVEMRHTPMCFIDKQEVYYRYQDYCKDHGKTAVAQSKFWTRVYDFLRVEHGITTINTKQKRKPGGKGEKFNLVELACDGVGFIEKIAQETGFEGTDAIIHDPDLVARWSERSDIQTVNDIAF